MLQAVSSRTQHESVLEEIRVAFPKSVNEGTKEEGFVCDYLKKLHPTSSTLLGNYKRVETKLQWFNTELPNTPTYGESLPQYGVRSMSDAEGENNTFILEGIRDCFP